MRISPSTVVVVTGASAGVGRAVATAFARRGAKVALLAREADRLDQARQEVSALGAQALAIAVDMADEVQVEAAAEHIEQALGPIDVWVNNAMVTVVGPVSAVTPEEFRQVSEVTYHGTVWGTMAALKRMRRRNRGSIVQVGSALSYRAIPLQAAYCGAKHAIRGFTEALRTELLHDQSRIHLSMVQLPAINTPQFEWCRTKLRRHPKPLGIIYQPEVAARAVLYAARGHRREIHVALTTTLAIWGDKLFPGLLDRYLAHEAYAGQQMQEPVPPDRPDNLFQPVAGSYGAHGRFDRQARPFSLSLWINLHRRGLAAGAVGLLALALAAARAPGMLGPPGTSGRGRRRRDAFNRWP